MKKLFVLYSPLINSYQPKLYKTLTTVKKHLNLNPQLNYKEFSLEHTAYEFISQLRKKQDYQKLKTAVNSKQSTVDIKTQTTIEKGTHSCQSLYNQLLAIPQIKIHLNNFFPSQFKNKMNQNDSYIGFFDGCSKGNPGKSSLGYYIEGSASKNCLKNGAYIGFKTNNQAEFCGLLWCLADAYCHQIRSIQICGDSKIVIYGMRDIYHIRSYKLIPIFKAAKILQSKFGSVKYNHIPRTSNSIADKIANDYLKMSMRQYKKQKYELHQKQLSQQKDEIQDKEFDQQQSDKQEKNEIQDKKFDQQQSDKQEKD